jgi:uncharacterized protein (TIGR02597 family)
MQAVIKNTIMSPSAQKVLRLAAGVLLTTVVSTLAQVTTATTDPVGFITLGVNGTGGVGQEALSFRGLGLTRAVEYQGSAETVGTNTLVDNEATWTDNQFNGANGAYFLEVTTGPGAGTIYDIAGTSAGTKTITLGQNLAAGITAPVTFKVRKHWTIGSVFGPANESGLGGGAQGEADEVLIFNPVTGSFQTFYFKVGGLGGNGWRNASTGADATNQIIYADDGMLIRRRQSSNVNVVLLGAVKTGVTSIPVLTGVNYVGNVYAASMTLGSSNLYTGSSTTGLVGGAQGEADEVLIYNEATKNYLTYYYKVGGLGGNGWRKANDGSDATNAPIPVGSSIVIRRKAATGFNWVAPQHPASI